MKQNVVSILGRKATSSRLLFFVVYGCAFVSVPSGACSKYFDDIIHKMRSCDSLALVPVLLATPSAVAVERPVWPGLRVRLSEH